MTLEEEALLDPELREGLADLRHELRLQPTTRLDELIFRDGSCFRLLASGSFIAVRGALGWPGPRGR